MALQLINRGTSANDGTGDVPRDAALKINENFTELYHSKPFNVLDYGAIGDGVTDDTAAFQAAIDAALVPTASSTVGGGELIVPRLPPGLQYRITASLVLAHGHGLYMRGPNASGQLDAVQLKWDGANGGTVFSINRCRDCVFEGFGVVPGTGTVGIGFDIDQSGSPTIGSDITTSVSFRRVHVGSPSIAGFRLSGSENNELHVFEDVTVDNYGGVSPARGILFNNQQSKFNRIMRGNLAFCTVAAIDCQAGSFDCWGTNFSQNAIDVKLGSPTDTIEMAHCQSESAGQFLAATSPSGAAWAVTIIGGRLDTNGAGSANYIDYQKGGPLTLIGNDFANGNHYASVAFKGNPNTSETFIALIGNVFPNSDNVFVSAFPTLAQWRVLGFSNLYIDSGGVLRSLAIAEYVSQSLVYAATIAVDAAHGELCSVVLTGNAIVGAPTHPKVGQRLLFIIRQDGTGGWTLGWDAVFKQAWSDAGNTANKISTIDYVYDGTNWIQDGAQSLYF